MKEIPLEEKSMQLLKRHLYKILKVELKHLNKEKYNLENNLMFFMMKSNQFQISSIKSKNNIIHLTKN